MNSLAKKIGLTGLLLLLSACAHYPRQYGYYPDGVSYGGGYSVIQRSYYAGTPDYYKGYDTRREYFRPRHRDQHHDFRPHHRDQHHDSRPWNHESPSPRYQHDPGYNRHSYDSHQKPRQEYRNQRRDDYAGQPEPRHHEHMKNGGGRQFERHAENQNRRPPQENRGRHNQGDERRESAHDRPNHWRHRDDHVKTNFTPRARPAN